MAGGLSQRPCVLFSFKVIPLWSIYIYPCDNTPSTCKYEFPIEFLWHIYPQWYKLKWCPVSTWNSYHFPRNTTVEGNSFPLILHLKLGNPTTVHELSETKVLGDQKTGATNADHCRYESLLWSQKRRSLEILIMIRYLFLHLASWNIDNDLLWLNQIFLGWLNRNHFFFKSRPQKVSHTSTKAVAE